MTEANPEFDEQLPIEQLILLRKQSVSAFAATMAVLFYIIFKIYDLVDSFWLNTWVGVVLFMNVYLLVWLYFVHHTKITPNIAKRFIRIYQAQAFMHGLSWGMLPFLLADLTTPEMKFFAYIVLCGMSAGAIGTTAMIYRIYLTFMLPTMLPSIFTQLFLGDNITLFSVNTLELLIIYVISLVVLGHTHYDSTKKSITLMLANNKLLAETTDAFEKAEAASFAKSNFLANMSHELRTPLNAIIGYSELIYDNSMDEQFETLSSDSVKITNAGKHLLSLINNVLDLSKIESGKMDVYIEDIGIYNLLNDIKDTMEKLILKNNNTLIFDVSKNIGIIKSDLTKIRQILLNIIGNAAKFTSNGEIKIEAHADSDRLNISISDTGIGMSTVQLKELTTPFMQADASTTKKYGGTGLGMSLTEHLTKLLGIKLTVTSAPDKGTCFDLSIPFVYSPA